MLFFYSTRSEKLEDIREKGIQKEVVLRSCMKKEGSESTDALLVINPFELDSNYRQWYGEEEIKVDEVPSSAIVNVDPYREPEYVVAGGGFLVREGRNEQEILMIYRKGLWDLPKGKLDEGESIVECAVREVKEEVGIDGVDMIQSLGSTLHMYERKSKLYVKRTYWYEMRTAASSFSPQEDEQIEEVQWFTWSEAKKKVGYPIFRMHMEHVEEKVIR